MHQGEEEGWYVLEGELTFRLGDQTVRAPAGSFVLAPRGMLHSFGNTGTQTAKYLELFSPPGMERFFADLAALSAKSPNGRMHPRLGSPWPRNTASSIRRLPKPL